MVGGLLDGVGSNKRVQDIVISWLAPLLLGSFAFVIIVLPDVRSSALVSHITNTIATLHVNKFLFIFIASFATASFLYLNRIPLWRFLEGYTWPDFAARWRIKRAHIPQRCWLEAKLYHERAHLQTQRTERDLRSARTDGAPDGDISHLEQAVAKAKKDEEGWLSELQRRNQLRHRRNRARKYPRGLGWLPRSYQPLFTPRPPRSGCGEWQLPYPASANKVLPTRLGNAMRVMETYGSDTYGLDSQLMWFELISEASEVLQDVLGDFQFETDTLVCGIYTAIALAGTAFAGGIWRATTGVWDLKLWFTAIVSLLVAELFYRRLLNSIDGWALAVHALVNTAREPLRVKYGLRRPMSHAEEKQMWEAQTGTLFYGYDPERERILASYRITQENHNQPTIGSQADGAAVVAEAE